MSNALLLAVYALDVTKFHGADEPATLRARCEAHLRHGQALEVTCQHGLLSSCGLQSEAAVLEAIGLTDFAQGFAHGVASLNKGMELLVKLADSPFAPISTSPSILGHPQATPNRHLEGSTCSRHSSSGRTSSMPLELVGAFETALGELYYCSACCGLVGETRLQAPLAAALHMSPQQQLVESLRLSEAAMELRHDAGLYTAEQHEQLRRLSRRRLSTLCFYLSTEADAALLVAEAERMQEARHSRAKDSAEDARPSGRAESRRMSSSRQGSRLGSASRQGSRLGSTDDDCLETIVRTFSRTPTSASAVSAE